VAGETPMAELKNKIQNALDEARMLVIGMQILIGFEYRIALEPGFDELSPAARALALMGLALLLVAFGLVLMPGSFHRLVEQGEDTSRLLQLTLTTMGAALAPFALALGLDLYIVGEHMAGPALGIVAGAAVAMVALGAWYGIAVLRKAKRTDDVAGKTELSDKIRHVLTEARVVLPGAQALLGFELLGVFMSAFDRLPRASRVMHFCGLVLTALAIILLMMPAAYHRLVERGEETERFHRFASGVVVIAMAVLGAGIACDFYVVVQKITGSTTAGVVAAVALVVLFGVLWFGYAFWVRTRERGRPTLRPASSRAH
jgi:Family of unknown function (DUF6328)